MGGAVKPMASKLSLGCAILIGAALFLFILAGCPTSALLTEVKYRSEGTYTQLASLSLPGATLSPAFSPSVTTYAVSVPYATTSITLTPMAYKSDASITVNGTAVQSGSVSPAVALSVGSNTITIQVTYPNTATMTYTVKVTRLSQVDLTSLALTASPLMNLTLSPAFRPLVSSYTLAVAYTCTSVTITPTPADPAANVTINPPNPIAAPNVGSTTTVTIVVTSPDGKGSHTYTIVLSRAALSYVLDTNWGSSGRVGSDLSGIGCLYAPSSIAVAAGQVYIFDGNNYRIQNFTTSGSPVQRWGSYGGGAGQFYDSNGGVAYDSGRGYVYVAANNVVQKFNASNGTFVQQFGSGLSWSMRLACDSSGNVFVADQNNNRVLKFDQYGSLITSWGSYGSGSGQFDNPMGIAIDSASNVYVANRWGGRVQKFTNDGVWLLDWPTPSFSQIQGMAADSSNNIYVAGWNQTQKYNSSGVSQGSAWSNPLNAATDIATDSANLYYLCSADYRVHKTDMLGVDNPSASWGSDLLTAASSLNAPQRVAVDSSKNIYVVDLNNNRVEKFGPTGTYLWTSSGTTLNQPYGIALDASANVYVADSANNRIAKFNGGTGVFDGTWSAGITASNPRGVAFDGAGNVYVADHNRISKLLGSGAFSTSWALTYDPCAAAVDSSDNVYVADPSNYRIQKFTNTGSLMLQWGSQGSGNGKFNKNVTDVAVDPTGGVFVAQWDFFMQKFDSSGAYLLTLPSSNWDAFGPRWIVGAAVDASGNVYLVDSSDMSVRRYKPQ